MTKNNDVIIGGKTNKKKKGKRLFPALSDSKKGLSKLVSQIFGG